MQKGRKNEEERQREEDKLRQKKREGGRRKEERRRKRKKDGGMETGRKDRQKKMHVLCTTGTAAPLSKDHPIQNHRLCK